MTKPGPQGLVNHTKPHRQLATEPKIERSLLVLLSCLPLSVLLSEDTCLAPVISRERRMLIMTQPTLFSYTFESHIIALRSALELLGSSCLNVHLQALRQRIWLKYTPEFQWLRFYKLKPCFKKETVLTLYFQGLGWEMH